MFRVDYDLTYFISLLSEKLGTDANEYADKLGEAVEKAFEVLSKDAIKRFEERTSNWDLELRFIPIFESDPKNHIYSFAIRISDASSVNIISPSAIFRWVDEGVGFHKIPDEPKGAHDALMFRFNDMVVYAKQVDHPGIEPQEISKGVQNEIESIMDGVIMEELGKATEQIIKEIVSE